MANAPKRIVKEVKPGVTVTHVALTVVATIFVTILLKVYIKSPTSPFPDHWADLA